MSKPLCRETLRRRVTVFDRCIARLQRRASAVDIIILSVMAYLVFHLLTMQ